MYLGDVNSLIFMGELRACADSFSERPKFLRDIAFTKFSYFLYENDETVPFPITDIK